MLDKIESPKIHIKQESHSIFGEKMTTAFNLDENTLHGLSVNNKVTDEALESNPSPMKPVQTIQLKTQIL
jgi:hypothetical protein